ncbi:hypothetical protein [Rhizobium sp. BK251]|uniref:hypothetical protein n=1 Tax=Rhizobium sp. BK251 TaxID=2512125 RepID=UPI0010519BEE|nr:hypothetical protein [Rhizobium sp. BK251]TCL62713.1 hypothetical protein EV286_11945 [Rhizobium sp. BK251]
MHYMLVDDRENGERDSIVVISQAAAGEIAKGRLPFAQGQVSGVVFVDALDVSAPSIRSAFMSAYPVGAFSDFICTEVA